jgi:geranylgeranyl reductase family protein
MKYDVIVIGGGPAGSSAALRAARLGARVLLLEKNPMPRPKLCGGWVSNYALRLFRFDVATHLIETPFHTLTLADEKTSVTFSPKLPLGILVDRAEFDHFLVEQAMCSGAEVRWQKAVAVEHQGGSIQVRTTEQTHEAGGVVICTGASGDLVRTVRALDTPRQSAACVEQRVPVDFADNLAISVGEARLNFGTVPHGYAWVLHHGTYLLVGIGCRRYGSPDLRDAFKSFWERLTLPPDLFHPVGHLIPIGGFRRRVGRGRCLLAGDAAGMVDALSGEGIAGAIESGQLAADALAADGRRDAARLYSDACRRALLPHLRWSLAFAWGFYRQSKWFLQLLNRCPGSLDRYGEVLEHRHSYAWYLSKLLKDRFRSLIQDKIR